MGKRRKNATQFDAWCWYCDREFEDEKVLLQHQRAKHYRCPYCPRRLNTAGGLTVHLHQVHKAEPTIIENALPGRESFDIEIYGMVGIPEADLLEWQSRKGENGQNNHARIGTQKPKIDKGVISVEQLKIQLEAHKALMSGKAPPPGTAQALFGMSFPPSIPPPGIIPNNPPPPFHMGMQRPPPPVPGMGMPPYSGPPPGYPYPPPNVASGQKYAQNNSKSNASIPSFNPHEQAVKQGAKTRIVYSDANLSPEEKLASIGKYNYIDPEDVKSIPQPPPNFSVPPPGFGRQSGTSQFSIPPPGFGSPSRPPPAQVPSYPAVQANALPPSANPLNNTAEALASVNQQVSQQSRKREADVERIQGQSNGKRLREEEVGKSNEVDEGDTNTGSGRSSRTRAADLF